MNIRYCPQCRVIAHGQTCENDQCNFLGRTIACESGDEVQIRKLKQDITSLQTRLEAAEGENGRLFVVEQELEAEKRFIASLRKQLTAAESRAQQAEEMAGRLRALLLERHKIIGAAYGEGMCESAGEAQHAQMKNDVVMSWLERCEQALSTSPPSDRTDGERLDWMHQRTLFFSWWGGFQQVSITGYKGKFNSVRECIDAAMSASLPVTENQPTTKPK